MTLTHFERQVKVHDEAITRTPPLLLCGSYRVPSSSRGEGGASSPPSSSLSAPSSQAVDEGMLTAVIFWTNHDVSGWLATRRSVPTERTDHSPARPQELAAPSPPIGLGSSHTIFGTRLHPMGEVRMSRHQVRYAMHGIGIGLTASVVLISGMIMILRLSLGKHIGHRVPFSFVLFTTIFVLIVYRLRRKYFYVGRKTARSTRSATQGAVTELSQSSAGDHTKSA
jgi:hypothetical protein